MKHFQMNSIVYFVFSLLIFCGIRYRISKVMTSKLHAELTSYMRIEEVHEHVCVSPEEVERDEMLAENKMRGFLKGSVKWKEKPTQKSTKTAAKRKPVNINSSKKEELIALPGLGEVFSARIIKFRDRLGGFYSIDQLADVYGLPPETVTSLAPYLTCDGRVLKLDLAKDEFKKILRHPYVDYEQVKGIKNYIRKHGPIDSLEALISATGKDASEAKKLLPYIVMSSQPVTLAP